MVIAFLLRKAEVQVAERLVGHAMVGIALDVLCGHVLCFFITSLPHQLPHAGQVFQRLGIGIVVGPASPNSLFVELESLIGHTPEDHGTQAAIADGQCLVPVSGGLRIPQLMGTAGMSGG